MAKRNPAVNPVKALGKKAGSASKDKGAREQTFGGGIRPQSGAKC